MKFATWSAVSSKAQAAADKVSLDLQTKTCTEAGRARGWQHVRDYIVPGESRTAYLSLYHAEKSIPQLHQMLEDASKRKFDVLIVYDLDRFRSLMRQVFDALCDFGVQLFFLSDPREPVQPEHYTDEIKSAVGMTVDLRGIISNSQINNLHRHYRDKMPRRITDKGLHPGLGLPPYGYAKPLGHEYDRAAVLVQIPGQISTLLKIKELFFAGYSLTAIADQLNREGIPSPRGKRWWYSIVAYLLANPYYAGRVGFGYTHRQRIRRDGTVKRVRGESPITNAGKHQPVWDDATHQRILAELERRGQAHPGIKTRVLSRLLTCSVCGSVLWAQIDATRNSWRCSRLQTGHTAIRDDVALTRVTEALQYAVTHLDELHLPTAEDERPALEAELRELNLKKKRWLDAFESGQLDIPDLADRIRTLEERIRSTTQRIEQSDRRLAQTDTLRAGLAALAVAAETLPTYLRDSPPQQVNAHLRSLLASITVNPDQTVTLNWR